MPDDSPNSDVSDAPKLSRRGITILMAIATMVAVSGFFMGLRQGSNFAEKTQTNSTARVIASTTQPVPAVGDEFIPVAPRYADLPATLTTPNKNWIQTLATLPTDSQPALPPLNALTAGERDLVLNDRAARRAYDGAPPVVPHPIDQSASTSCVTCHGTDTQFTINGRRPPMMSHGFLVNCIQCHVPASGPVESLVPEWSGPRISETSFVGRSPEAQGTRAYPGAPPTMPHSTLMRENCLSCHDAGRPNAIRTTHPDRSNCAQCHAQSAVLDRRSTDLTGIREELQGIILAPPPAKEETPPAVPPADEIAPPPTPATAAP